MAAGAGAYPKPDSERTTRHKTGFEWTNLPECNNSPIPPMPCSEKVDWSQEAKALWDKLWYSPQSTQWPRDLHPTVERYVALYERMYHGQDLSGATMNAMTQIEDRLGLNPKAMLQVRWRVVPSSDNPDLAVVKPISESKPKRNDPRKGA